MSGRRTRVLGDADQSIAPSLVAKTREIESCTHLYLSTPGPIAGRVVFARWAAPSWRPPRTRSVLECSHGGAADWRCLLAAGLSADFRVGISVAGLVHYSVGVVGVAVAAVVGVVGWLRPMTTVALRAVAASGTTRADVL